MPAIEQSRIRNTDIVVSLERVGDDHCIIVRHNKREWNIATKRWEPTGEIEMLDGLRHIATPIPNIEAASRIPKDADPIHTFKTVCALY